MIFTSDISNFWSAYDKVLSTNDTIKQAQFIQTVYIDKATEGLADFIKLRSFTSTEWIKSFQNYPKFWNSIRPKTQLILTNSFDIENIYKRFLNIYPNFHQPKTYFTIGCFKGGGVSINGKLIIGSELASSDSTVDASELSKSNQDRMKVNTGIAFLVAHESVHTQQKTIDDTKSDLLGKCLQEGSADFIAELLTQKPVQAPYINYGFTNELTLWNKFKTEMYNSETDDWLYNIRFIKDKPADLGYFMGYTICKNYYDKTKNKKKAIKEIIELDYSDKEKVRQFLKKSKYADK